MSAIIILLSLLKLFFSLQRTHRDAPPPSPSSSLVPPPITTSLCTREGELAWFSSDVRENRYIDGMRGELSVLRDLMVSVRSDAPKIL